MEKSIIDNYSEEPKFYSTVVDRWYYIKRDEKGRLNLFDAETCVKYPSYNFPITKKDIAKKGLLDLGIEYPIDIKVNDAIRMLRNEINKRKRNTKSLR